MGNVDRFIISVLVCLLVLVLLAACGDTAQAPVSGAGGAATARYGAGSPVESEEAAIAAVRGHLFLITSCQAARDRVQRDIAAGKFNARQVYTYQAQNPVWEVAVATDQHVPFVNWWVEQGDGTVVPSISAATYYQSPLLHVCGQIYAATGGGLLRFSLS